MILLLGHTGFLGQTVATLLDKYSIAYKGFSLSDGGDIRDESTLSKFIFENNFDIVMNCASFSGGLQFAMSNPVEIYHKNMDMVASIYRLAQRHGVKRIINPISNCVYPAKASLFKEEELWEGALHESVFIYGFTRRAILAVSWAYRKQFGLDSLNIVMSNMYGPRDHFDLMRSHALGALIMKFVEAQRVGCPVVNIWGTGKPVREWLFVEDAAEAMLKGISSDPYPEVVNIGTGTGVSMKELAEKVASISGFKGTIQYDISKPDGATYKTVDGSKGREVLDFVPYTTIENGISRTIEWYKRNH